MSRTALSLLLTLATAGALVGCAPDVDRPALNVNPPDVRVDTPELRDLKARIGMADCEPGGGESVETGLPSMTLPCLGGGAEVDLAALRGPLVINLWQAFCSPCRKEMPALQSFHEQYGDRVAVLGIDFNDVRPDAALALAEETEVTYPSLADPGGDLLAQDAFAVARRGLPAFVFVDDTGRVAGVSSGGVDSVAEVVALVDEHLGVEL